MASNKAATWIAFRSIVKRSLTTTSSPTRTNPLRSSQLLQAPHHQTITSSTSLFARKIPRNHFTSNRASKADEYESGNDASKAVKRKAASKRVGATNNSLRKVAVEAQRTRLTRTLIKGTGKLRHIDPEADTKDVTAYCAAETYNLHQARHELSRMGYSPDPCGTGLFPQVLHVQTPNYVAKNDETGEESPQGAGDLFVFPSGCVVTWNVPEKLAYSIVHRFLPTAAGNSGHLDKLEAEDLEYIEDPSKDTSRIIGDTIILGTKATGYYQAEDRPIDQQQDHDARSPETDTVLAKVAFSSALARSTKLAVLENSLSEYFSSTRSIPLTLASGKPISINRSQILQKTGQLLLIRAQLNLYSELTDSLPDLFWDSPHELGLEGYYEMVGRALDVGIRIKALNEKMDYASEIAAVLRERLSEKHSTMLEWMIIGLICIEVGFGIVHLWRESDALHEKDDERRTRDLFEVWLERELRKKG